MTTTTDLPRRVTASLDRFVRFLESGGADVPDGLWAPEVFGDLTFPHWRIQTEGAEALAETRRLRHPYPGSVRVERVVETADGYAVTLEERWRDGGQDWYCRESFLLDLDEDGRISGFTLYCTGDWDEARQREHAETVRLVRP